MTDQPHASPLHVTVLAYENSATALTRLIALRSLPPGALPDKSTWDLTGVQEGVDGSTHLVGLGLLTEDNQADGVDSTPFTAAAEHDDPDASRQWHDSGMAVGVVVALLPAIAERDGLLPDGPDAAILGLVTAALEPADLDALRAVLADHPVHAVFVSLAPLGVQFEPLAGGATATATARLHLDPVTLRAAVATQVVPPMRVLDGSPLTRPHKPHSWQDTRISFDLPSLWRAGVLVVGLVALTSIGYFVFTDGGSVIFNVVMSFLAAVAMEPAVNRLSRYMKRGLATGVVMISVVLFAVVFFAAFGQLLLQQLSALVAALPAAIEAALGWLNETFHLSLSVSSLLEQLNITPSAIAAVGADFAGGVIGAAVAVLGGFFSSFTIGLFIFYLSADAPRLKRWIAKLMPPQRQQVFVVVWDLAVQKTGGYVAARVVLAGICGSFTAVWLLIIGMDYWLPLGIWTGVVAQFVPTIGTYLAIALPVLVGLTSADPIDGVLALAFALVYQQIENLTIEPKISADAVDMHPAVSFGSVLLGAALFGVAGALVAVPVAALLLSLFEIYSRTYQLLPELTAVSTRRRRLPGLPKT